MAAALGAERDTARAMSQENVKTVRDAFVAYNRGDLDAFLDEYWTDDIDYRAAEGALDDHGPIQGKDALRAWADLSLLDDVSGIAVEDGVVQVGPNLMTGHEGICGRRHGPGRADVTVGVGHGKKAARNIDGWLRSRHPSPGPSTRSSPSTSSTPGTTPSTGGSAARARDRAPSLHFDEVVAGWTSRMPCTRLAAAWSAATASADNCFGVCPDNAVVKLAEAAENPNVNGYANDLDFCTAAASASRMPLRCMEMIREKM